MKRKIIIGVGIAGHTKSAAGNSWCYLQYALGFRDLGWDVWVVESLPAKSSVNASGQPSLPSESEPRLYWDKILGEFNLLDQGSLWIGDACNNEESFRQFAKDASVFLNVSGHFKRLDLVAHIPHRTYLDTDPAFVQVWAKAYNVDMNFAGHNHFCSAGTRMNLPGVILPETGHNWIPFPPPVYLPDWTQSAPLSTENSHWTTVAHWHGYPAVEWNGISYDNKSPNFQAVLDLPKHTAARLAMATDATPEYDEYPVFTAAGWKLILASGISANWHDYRRFLGGSRGEFSVAKQGYVVSKCGWFSDRSVCYLALGRPVILQDTGWSEVIPHGTGLLPFSDVESAASALGKVEADYDAHCLGARKIAEDTFSTRVVFPKFLESIGIST